MLRPVVPVCAGCAMAHPDFGRSVNPISNRGDRLCPPNYKWHTRIFIPSDGPDAVVVFGLGKDLLFKSVLGRCVHTLAVKMFGTCRLFIK